MALAKVTIVQEVGDEYRIQGYAYTQVPAAPTNDAGIPWRDVVAAQWRANNFRRDIDPPVGVTLTDIESGAVHVWRFRASAATSLTGPQILAEVEAQVESQETGMQATMMDELRFWGFEFDTDD